MTVKLMFNDNNIKEFEKSMSGELDKVIKHFESELLTIRTGRAHPALVESIKIACYGGANTMPLRQVATIASPESHLLTIDPWDKAIVNDIVKALGSSELGVNPETDGAVIFVRLPQMSSERRDELVKILGKKAEDSRIAVRNVRKDFHNMTRDAQKNKEISEDHARRLNDILQKITDKYIADIDAKLKTKEKDLKG
ncbi:MAG: ribosome recycling factor [Candidatus Babeliales bacterium]